ncbi:MAG TPA: hypothetical protein VMT85_12235 [Thermoanaerobaculia bacterium]|nr:hypothetical protein [Thermoanaerobaculia bacterium]
MNTLPELSGNNSKARARLGRDVALQEPVGCGDAEIEIDGRIYRVILSTNGPHEWWRRAHGRFEDEVRWDRCGETETPTARELTRVLVEVLRRTATVDFRGPREVR